MVLFHTTFVALKARCPLTVDTNPEDYKLAGEHRLFQGYLHFASLGADFLLIHDLTGEF